MVGRGHVRPATPMIGRKAEIALVVTRWEAAAEGDGQVMVVSGEAGIGKSRIVFALGPDLAEDEANQLTMFGSTIHKNTAFYSVKTALFALLSMAEADPDDVKRQKLRNFIDRMGLDHVLVASPIAGLLGFGEDLGADFRSAFSGA